MSLVLLQMLVGEQAAQDLWVIVRLHDFSHQLHLLPHCYPSLLVQDFLRQFDPLQTGPDQLLEQTPVRERGWDEEAERVNNPVDAGNDFPPGQLLLVHHIILISASDTVVAVFLLALYA